MLWKKFEKQKALGFLSLFLLSLVAWRLYKTFSGPGSFISGQTSTVSKVHIQMAHKTKVFEPVYYYGTLHAKESRRLYAENRSVLDRFIALPGSLVRPGAELVQLRPLVSGFLPTILRAPIGGIFLEAFGNTGDLIDAGQPVLSIGDPSELVVHASLASEDIAAALKGAFIVLKLNDPAAEIRTVEVPLKNIFVAPAISPQSVGHLAKFTFTCPNEHVVLCREELKVNEIVELVVERDARDSLLVPLVALRDDRKNIFVIDEENKAHIRPVKLGKTFQKNVEVLEGLSEGEKFVRLGAPPPKDGALVEIIETDEGKSESGGLSKKSEENKPG